MTDVACVRDLGRRPYREVLALMRELHARVAAGDAPATWLVVEHEPVVTLGRNAGRASLRLSEAALAARGVDVVTIERGGDATYHGPGMLVVYPIVRLTRFREVVPFVTALEDATLAALATLGLAGMTRSDHRGVYVADRAIAAIGLAVRQMTTLHGLALDVDSGRTYDRLIAPCGLAHAITSVSHELGRGVPLGEARDALLGAIATRFALRFVAETCAA